MCIKQRKNARRGEICLDVVEKFKMNYLILQTFHLNLRIITFKTVTNPSQIFVFCLQFLKRLAPEGKSRLCIALYLKQLQNLSEVNLKGISTLRPRIICRSIFWQCNMQFQTEVNEISLVVSPHSYQRIFQILG